MDFPAAFSPQPPACQKRQLFFWPDCRPSDVMSPSVRARASRGAIMTGDAAPPGGPRVPGPRGLPKGRGRGGQVLGETETVPASSSSDLAAPTSSENALRATSTPFIPRSLPPAARPSPSVAVPAPTTTAPKGKRGGGKDTASRTPNPLGAKSEPKKQPPGKRKDETKQQQTPSTNPSPATTTDDRWWKTISNCDPITLEPLCDLAYPPFELARAVGETIAHARDIKKNGQKKKQGQNPPDDPDAKHLFDPPVLAEYVVKSKQFENPLNRLQMTEKDCMRLDNHLATFRLKTFFVVKAFKDAIAERTAAAAERLARENETAETAQRRVEQLQSELAESLFMSMRARGARTAAQTAVQREGGRGGGPGRGNAARGGMGGPRDESFVREGGLAMIDDDQGMRGRTLVRSSGNDQWQWEDASHLLEGPVEAFPALGGGRRASAAAVAPQTQTQTPRSGPNAFPALSSAAVVAPGPAGSSGGGFLWSAMAQTVSSSVPVAPATTRRPIRVQSVPKPEDRHVALDPLFLGYAPYRLDADDGLPSNQPADADPSVARRRQLADAFGVRNPDARPSVFASSALEQFTKEVVKTARAFPREISKMEHQLEKFVDEGTKKRISFEVAPRKLRAVGHALAQTFGCATCAYGNEPNRHIDVFRTDRTSWPSIRLSDAVKFDAAQHKAEGLEKQSIKTREKEEKEVRVAVRLSVVDGEQVYDEDSMVNAITLTFSDQPQEMGSSASSCGAQTVQMNLSFAPDGARGARAGPSPGDPWFPDFTSWYSRGRWVRLEIRFSDFEQVELVKRSLSEFSGEFAWEVLRKHGSSAGGGGGLKRLEDGDDVSAHFFRKETYDQVVGKIGGGQRGRFRAKGFVERGDLNGGVEDEASVRGESSLNAARRQAKQTAATLFGGKAPRVPGAFGKGKDPSSVDAPTHSAWEDDEDVTVEETGDAFQAVGREESE